MTDWEKQILASIHADVIETRGDVKKLLGGQANHEARIVTLEEKRQGWRIDWGLVGETITAIPVLLKILIGTMLAAITWLGFMYGNVR